ncbi:unnamed protein product, partial [Rotaria sp. Silwood1]
MFTAFTRLFYLLFNVHLYEFSTLFITAQTCFEMVTLNFNTADNLKNIDLLLAAICLLLFVALIVCFLVNMFISIIVDNFNLIRYNVKKEKDQYEMIKF